MFLTVLFLCFAKSSGMKGYNFADNKMNVRMGPDDGFLRKDFSGLIPSAVTVCLRFYPNYNRHGDQLGLWNIRIPFDDRYPVFDFVCKSKGQCGSEFHGTILDKSGNYPKVNWLRKWTSICVGLDFVNDNMVTYFNGEKFNRTELEKDRQPLTLRFPEGYFEGRS